jgi:uncharacterized lipoprotein YddW (UPF0748 family)
MMRNMFRSLAQWLFHAVPWCLLALVPLSSFAQAPPPPLREFRAAWVATVRGVDWPFEAGDPPAKQQAEIVAIVEKAAKLKLNALIFQVRPAGDAVYKSELEPWSPWFTGGMGKAPDPVWDPLEFFINEAHARGIELHAWFNPFRALSGSQYSGAGKHVSVQHPEWCWRYGEDLWMDPGEPGVREHSKAVMLDVLRRYEVDGIHMDDYFYPYPKKNGSGVVMDFPDDRTWKNYQATGGKLDRPAWRRSNVDTFVRELYEAIKKEKSWVRFGISPFGIWRPNNPEGYAKGALDPYQDLAADSLKWLQSGWCDYMAPQLYWPSEPKNLSFPALYDWWLTQNTARRHVWPGMASERVLQDRQPHEILRQISHLRQRAAYMPPGHIHWNFSALGKNKGTVADLCRERAYQEGAIIPSASWLGSDKPDAPTLQVVNGLATWGYSDTRLESFARWWVLQTFDGKSWITQPLQPLANRTFTLSKEMKGIAVRTLSYTGIASDPVIR